MLDCDGASVLGSVVFQLNMLYVFCLENREYVAFSLPLVIPLKKDGELLNQVDVYMVSDRL